MQNLNSVTMRCFKHLRRNEIYAKNTWDSANQWCLYFKVIDYLNISVLWQKFISENTKHKVVMILNKFWNETFDLTVWRWCKNGCNQALFQWVVKLVILSAQELMQNDSCSVHMLIFFLFLSSQMISSFSFRLSEDAPE